VWTPGIKKPDVECNNKCSGNKEQFCGGKGRISVYRNFNYDTNHDTGNEFNELLA
jgi:hypothetical protein